MICDQNMSVQFIVPNSQLQASIFISLQEVDNIGKQSVQNVKWLPQFETYYLSETIREREC